MNLLDSIKQCFKDYGFVEIRHSVHRHYRPGHHSKNFTTFITDYDEFVSYLKTNSFSLKEYVRLSSGEDINIEYLISDIKDTQNAQVPSS